MSRCALEPRWLLDEEDERAVDLLAALGEARRPYDEELTRAKAERRREDAERERLRSDPEALRTHLRSWRHPDWGIERLGQPAAAALALTLEREGAPDEVERPALTALGAIFADPLRLQLGEREPSAEERRALDALVQHHRAEQLGRADHLAERFGEGPALSRARRRLADGELLGDYELGGLSSAAKRDSNSRRAQERLREDYLAWRQEEGRRLAKAQGFTSRLRNGPETFLDRIDRGALPLCRACKQVAYPDPERAERYAERHLAQRCHYCGAGALAEIESLPDEGGNL